MSYERRTAAEIRALRRLRRALADVSDVSSESAWSDVDPLWSDSASSRAWTSEDAAEFPAVPGEHSRSSP